MNFRLGLHLKKKMAFIFMPLVLNACAVSKESFDCVPGKGVGCRSISEVNQMMNENKLGLSACPQNAIQSDSTDAPNPTALLSAVSIPKHLTDKEALVIHRTAPQYLRVWVAPFEDEGGNLHEGTLVQTVLTPSQWQIEESF